MSEQNNNSRRRFIQQTAIAGAGLALAGPLNL
ncbi:twin-arginine translocation signal domain-containing protein [Chryseobacterium wangxinyae]|nr:twin-arginine translocation signal domain-containing protein [Chryseobacterium sp. CY353]MCY0970471.1 twin-arginine translocation signal domain-containing protein [Chryseobacterium sp. CY353]